jgi:hypothetical protein
MKRGDIGVEALFLGFRIRPLQRHYDLTCFQNAEQEPIDLRLTHHQSET